MDGADTAAGVPTSFAEGHGCGSAPELHRLPLGTGLGGVTLPRAGRCCQSTLPQPVCRSSGSGCRQALRVGVSGRACRCGLYPATSGCSYQWTPPRDHERMLRVKHVEVDPRPSSDCPACSPQSEPRSLRPPPLELATSSAGARCGTSMPPRPVAGVAEMLQTLHAYWLGAGIDAYWLVLRGIPDFFALTKRIHNVLHGEPGDGGHLKKAEHRIYEEVLADNLESMIHEIRPGDIMLLHDPQTAGLVEGLQRVGAKVIWRCHIGRDTTNKHTDRGWAFLRPYIENADAFVFSRREYAPDWVPRGPALHHPAGHRPVLGEEPVCSSRATSWASSPTQAWSPTACPARQPGSPAATAAPTSSVTTPGCSRTARRRPRPPSGSSCRSAAGTSSRTCPG